MNEIFRSKSIAIETLKSKYVGRIKHDALKSQLAPQTSVDIATIDGSSSVKAITTPRNRRIAKRTIQIFVNY